MNNFLYLYDKSQFIKAELAHAIGSSYPLIGCTAAEPISVSLDSVKVNKKLADTVYITLPGSL